MVLESLKEFINVVFQQTGKLLLYRLPRRRNIALERNRIRPGKDNRWFVQEEAVLLEKLASLIVPSEETTPGACELHVMGPSALRSLDNLVASSQQRQAMYTQGLIAFDELTQRNYNSRFIDLPISTQLHLLKSLEILDQTCSDGSRLVSKFKKKLIFLQQMWDGSFPAVELFQYLVRDVLETFYTSEVSWIWLNYDGPPMPHGYPELHLPRPRKRPESKSHLQKLAASGNGNLPPNIFPAKEMTDVVIIGSGAGGAVVAKELAEAGLSVVVLEAGKRYNPLTDYFTDRTDFESKAGKVFSPENNRRDLYTVTGSNWFVYNRAKGVGGSTLKYAACSPRFHQSDFRIRTEDGISDDWPITYEDLEPFYTVVEYELGVSGPTGCESNPFDPPRSKPFPTPAHGFNLASLVIKRGAHRLGLHMVREPLAIPSIEWNGRPACIGAGTCIVGCAISAKSSMDVTYLRTAEKTRRVEIRSQCMARRITVTPHGKARGVVYFDHEGREREIRARAIVLAGNAVETPRLLLLSKSSQFPDGLANSSGLVGKYFTEHLAVFTYGLFSERIDPWRGTPTGGMIQDYYATNKANAFARGWTTYVYCGDNWPYSVARRSTGWGAEHKRRTEQLFAHSVALASVGEQIPDVRNQVTLDPNIRDSYGLPVPRLTNELGKNDKSMIKAIQTVFKEILDSAGATEILENTFRPGGSSHYLGTCRMGLDPRSSVVNAWGRTHDVPNLFVGDGSVFVTGAAVNPALTISALAARTAAGIISAFQTGDL